MRKFNWLRRNWCLLLLALAGPTAPFLAAYAALWLAEAYGRAYLMVFLLSFSLAAGFLVTVLADCAENRMPPPD